MQQKCAHSQSFHNFLIFWDPVHKPLFRNHFWQIFSSLKPFGLGGTKDHTCWNKPTSVVKSLLLPLGIIRHKCKCKQNFSEEKLNSQKLIWFCLPEKKFLSPIICVPNFVASNCQKVITIIWLIFVFVSFYTSLPLF